MADCFNIKNDSDTQTDYFEKDTIRVIPSHPLYDDVKAAMIASQAKRSIPWSINIKSMQIRIDMWSDHRRFCSWCYDVSDNLDLLKALEFDNLMISELKSRAQDNRIKQEEQRLAQIEKEIFESFFK